MPKHIAVYTTNQCAYCGMVKRWLESKNLAFEEINIETNPERGEEAFSASGGRTVPVTIVTGQDDTKHVITGWNLRELVPAVSA